MALFGTAHRVAVFCETTEPELARPLLNPRPLLLAQQVVEDHRNAVLRNGGSG